jgi:hypothetical protein
MNTLNNTLRNKLTWLVALSILVLGAAGIRSISVEAQAGNQPPVWGSKPVLSYFALTGSLSEAMRTGLALTDAQWTAISQAAEAEAQSLRLLEQSSLSIVQDDELSLGEKRAAIHASGYNQQVLNSLSKTQAALQESLDAETYTRLVDWIEQRWAAERQAHGLQSLRQTSGARTYSIYATRFDTSSYIVALPDKCLKLANGGNHLCDDSGYETGQNYFVRLEYQDSVTVKVGDSGPWNADDNYWAGIADPQPRRLFPDLPAGMPEAQAAYFDDYNNGKDQFDRTVTAPFGIDLARQVSIDIGLNPGVNDWIEVTFPWTDGWDDIDADVVLLKDPSQLTPAYTGDMCVTAWHRITGYDDYAYLTLNVNDPDLSTNRAEWRPDFPAAGEYQVLAYVPDHPPIDWQCPNKTINRDTGDASYTIEHANGAANVSGNQGPLSNMWIDLGTYDFEAGRSGKVKLSDVTGEDSFTRTVAFSAMLFRQLRYPTPTPDFTPTPTVTPTPTPTPAPFVWTGSGVAPPSTTFTIPVGASHLQLPGLVSATIQLSYDPAVLSAASCLPDPQSSFDTAQCDPAYEQDGVNPDTLQFSLGSEAGVAGSPRLAEVGFRVVGAPGQFSLLDLLIQGFSGPGGVSIPAAGYDGLICVAPCRNVVYLPGILRAILPP